MEAISRELKVRTAIENSYYWAANCTKTKDEQDPENPFKPFPDREYLYHLFYFLDHWPGRIKHTEKSRTMMLSWAISAWTGHFGFTHPAMCTVFQSQDERRAVNDIDYVKELWKNSDPELRDRWPVPKPVEKQPQTEFHLSNGSKWLALARDPDAIRSAHPTIVVLDEAAHMVAGEESHDIAVGADPLHIIMISSAAEGWFEDACDSNPIDWPYPVERIAA